MRYLVANNKLISYAPGSPSGFEVPTTPEIRAHMTAIAEYCADQTTPEQKLIEQTNLIKELTETLTSVFSLFDSWQENELYPVGKIIHYNNMLFQVIQQHTSQADWLPDVTPSLYSKINQPEDSSLPTWIQPLGAHDAYPLSATVTHNEKNWISLVDNNIWEPGVYGWEEIQVGGE